MDPIKVLIVDDSAVVRMGIRKMLLTDPDIQVVGEAINGTEAILKREALAPDVVTMDVNMPGMNGLETTARIMSTHPVPILIVTDLDTADLAFEAIGRGALDLLGKAEINPTNAREFIRKIKVLSQVKKSKNPLEHRVQCDLPTPSNPVTGGHALDWIIATASSMGGPQALLSLLDGLGRDWRTPIVVAHHSHPDLLPKLAEWLDKMAPLAVRMSEAQQTLLPGHVYIAPADRNLEISPQGRMVFMPSNPQDRDRPSCNALLSSVVHRYGAQSIGVILTGMGDDGVLGAKAIKAAGGRVIAQDESTSAVYGMAQAAVQQGCVDFVLPIHAIGDQIRALIDRRRVPRNTVRS
ncbi:MAG: chemotaxis protein CheB [Magnetococcales bacterium]|nr:chemotaxis protein CheB [Magnetococcales bacterium]